MKIRERRRLAKSIASELTKGGWEILAKHDRGNCSFESCECEHADYKDIEARIESVLESKCAPGSGT